MPFRDRSDAGRRLAAALGEYSGRNAAVLALPRGGVPVAAEIASALHAPLDLVIVRKLGLPGEPELAMGAVVDGEKLTIVRNEDIIRRSRVIPAEFDAVVAAERAEIDRRRDLYQKGRRVEIRDRPTIVVDDGIATGATVKAALIAVRARHPSQIVLAVPVASSEALAELRDLADVVVCLEPHLSFGAIGNAYGDFRQLTDAEVISTLARFPVPDKT